MNASETNIVNSEPKIATPVTSDAKMVNLNEYTQAVLQSKIDIISAADIGLKSINWQRKTGVCFQQIYAQTYVLRVIVALNSLCLIRFIADQTVALGDGFYFLHKTFHLQLSQFVLIMF